MNDKRQISDWQCTDLRTSHKKWANIKQEVFIIRNIIF